MQDYLNMMTTTLADWTQLTIAQPWYALAWATVAAMLTAIVYKIKILALHRTTTSIADARDQAQTALSTTQQELQEKSDELAANVAQLQKLIQSAEAESRRAETLEDKLHQQHLRLTETVRALYRQFELADEAAPNVVEMDSEGLWQQFSVAVEQMSSLLRSEQQAKSELLLSYQTKKAEWAEKDALITKLKYTVSEKSSRIVELETALAAEKLQLQLVRQQAQQTLTQTKEKHVEDMARLVELEQQTLDLVTARQDISYLENVLHGQVDASVQTPSVSNAEFSVEPAQAESAEASLSESARVESAKDSAGLAATLKRWFGSTKAESKSVEPEPSPVVAVEAAAPNSEPEPEPELVVEPQALSPFTKFKSLLGLVPSSGSSMPTEVVEEVQPEPQPEEPVATIEPEATAEVAAISQFERFKSMLGLTKSRVPVEDPELLEPETVEVDSESDLAEQPGASKPVTGQLKKLRSLFGKSH